MKAFPDFNMQTRPYVLIKDRSTLSIVNLSNSTSIIVLKQCPFKWDCLRDYTLDIALSDDQKEIEVFTIEGELKDLNNGQGKQTFSSLKKYGIDISKIEKCLPSRVFK